MEMMRESGALFNYYCQSVGLMEPGISKATGIEKATTSTLAAKDEKHQ
jgi:hypothetical protein